MRSPRSPEARPDGGGWTAAVHGARASDLVRAFDPDQRFVVVERHSPLGHGWHAAALPPSPGPAPPRARTVRRVRFDVLLTPAEALAAGPEFDVGDQGALYAWQAPVEPPASLLLERLTAAARAAVAGRLGISLVVDLPHRGETAVLWSPQRAALAAALGRLRD